MRTATRTVSALMAAAVLFLAAAAANARQVCVNHDEAKTQLARQFDEQVVGRGLANSGRAMVELFVSETGSWTVVVSDTKGRSCVVASGEDWTKVPLLVGDPA